MFAGQAIPRDAFVIEYTGEVVPHSLAGESWVLSCPVAEAAVGVGPAMGCCLVAAHARPCYKVTEKISRVPPRAVQLASPPLHGTAAARMRLHTAAPGCNPCGLPLLCAPALQQPARCSPPIASFFPLVQMQSSVRRVRGSVLMLFFVASSTSLQSVPRCLPTADQREKRYEAEGTGTMYLFRLDSRSVIDATLKASSRISLSPTVLL